MKKLLYLILIACGVIGWGHWQSDLKGIASLIVITLLTVIFTCAVWRKYDSTAIKTVNILGIIFYAGFALLWTVPDIGQNKVLDTVNVYISLAMLICLAIQTLILIFAKSDSMLREEYESYEKE